MDRRTWKYTVAGRPVCNEVTCIVPCSTLVMIFYDTWSIGLRKSVGWWREKRRPVAVLDQSARLNCTVWVSPTVAQLSTCQKVEEEEEFSLRFVEKRAQSKVTVPWLFIIMLCRRHQRPRAGATTD